MERHEEINRAKKTGLAQMFFVTKAITSGSAGLFLEFRHVRKQMKSSWDSGLTCSAGHCGPGRQALQMWAPGGRQPLSGWLFGTTAASLPAAENQGHLTAVGSFV